MQLRKLNCIYYEQPGRCTNTKLKRSLFGIGPRFCVIPASNISSNSCGLSEQYKRPNCSPAPHLPRNAHS